MPATENTHTKSRGRMFKWMISGHKGLKHKQEKLNNAQQNNNNNNNKNNQKQEDNNKHNSTVLRITEPTDVTLNNNNQQQQQQQQQQQNGDINQNLEKNENGVRGELPPPLPPHPPPPVPPHANQIPHPPQQPLPPVPGGVGGDHGEVWRDAPGTCTLPRRGLVREDARFRSPSNPPPASRQPPPYTRHQPPPPPPLSRPPYIQPPPPRDARASCIIEGTSGVGGIEVCDGRERWERRHSMGPRDWLPQHRSWSTRQPDSGFDSLPAPVMSDDVGHPGSTSPDGGQREDQYESSEELVHARASPLSLSSVSTASSPHYPTIRPAKQSAPNTPHMTQSRPHMLPPSDSPNNPLTTQSRPHMLSPSDSPNTPHTTQSRPHMLSPSDSPPGPPTHHSTPMAPPASGSPEGALLSDSVYPQSEPQPRYAEIQESDERNTNKPRDPTGQPRDTTRRYRDISLPRDFRDNRDHRTYQDHPDDRLPRSRNPADDRRSRRPLTETEVDGWGGGGSRGGRGGDTSECLRVSDAPASQRRVGRGADGSDEQRRGDGCTTATANTSAPSSVSWMEWTQQLQAYVAWVNSQLRKRGGPLISDLRRDLQSGAVFADLIEIISGERVAGISRDDTSPQVCRDNLERVLSFMAAKRIRMTHITSKEVAEGNLKSIMRVILALAAHYKPQSVKSAPPPPPSQPQPQQQPQQPTTHHYPSTQDVCVGPDGPNSAPDKTPDLSANRRALVSGGGDEGAATGVLRRNPSMTAAPRDSSPVYENLMPRRVAPHRWAYDSLRASHKFQWSTPPQRRANLSPGPSQGSGRPNLDESSDDALNTSLNTSVDGEGDLSPRRATRPAALNFWQDLVTRGSGTQQGSEMTQPAASLTPPHHHTSDDSDNPFRYHTIHRMSGRRKLPQIPGAAAGGSRGTTPQQEPSPSSRMNVDSPLNDKSAGGDEGSREPEGRSQNSSPAASLVRGSSLEQWEGEDLKVVLRDLNATREQLMALHNLLQGPMEVTSRGVCTSPANLNAPASPSHTPPSSSPGCLTPPSIPSPCLTPPRSSPTCLTPSTGKEINGKESPVKNSSDGRASPNKNKLRSSQRKREGSVRKSHSKENHKDTSKESHRERGERVEPSGGHRRESYIEFSPQKETHVEKINHSREAHKKEGYTESNRHSKEGYRENQHNKEGYRENNHHRGENIKQSHHQKDGKSENTNHGKENQSHKRELENPNYRRNGYLEKLNQVKDHINDRRDDQPENSNNRRENHFENHRESHRRENGRCEVSKESRSEQQQHIHPVLCTRTVAQVRDHKAGHLRRFSHNQELDGPGRGVQEGRMSQVSRGSELLDKPSSSTVKQELMHLSLEKQALQAEKAELARVVEERESIINELRQQVQHRDRTIQSQRVHLDDAIRLAQNGKKGVVRGESPGGRGGMGVGVGAREELQLVREAIMSLRANFRETDPSQHTLDTLEQAIAVLIERGSGSGCVNNSSNDKSPRSSSDKRTHMNGGSDPFTKVIYFTERTVTPFMSTVGRRLGEVRLRDFKAMFDRPGSFRFHFKSYDPEYGMVKEEIINDDDILPGVDGKIIAWVEDDVE